MSPESGEVQSTTLQILQRFSEAVRGFCIQQFSQHLSRLAPRRILSMSTVLVLVLVFTFLEILKPSGFRGAFEYEN